MSHSDRAAAKFFLGTQGWSYKDWVGSFYPSGAKPAEYLGLYARNFDAVELDTTFYGTPTPSRVQGWAAGTPEDFQFTAKTPRAITHDRRLVDAETEFDGFLDVISGLGTKLGAILIQLPPDFAVSEVPALERFFLRLPPGFRFAAEVRHRSWLREETYELFARHGVAWTMIDLHYMPIAPRITTDWTYVRWLGDHRRIMRMNETQIDHRDDLHRWAQELEAISRRVERVYGFVNNHYSGHSPADVRTLRREVGLAEREGSIPRTEQGALL